MPEQAPSHPSLDTLADRASSGDAGAEESLFAALRERFIALAKRRLREHEVEDVVQDALGIAFRKYRTRPSGVPVLPWSLVVLRNAIGNAYQRRARAELQETTPAAGPGEAAASGDPADPLDREELVAQLVEAVRRLAGTHPRCGALFRHVFESLAQDGGPESATERAVTTARQAFPDMTAANFYVMLHRCRARLRSILDRMEGGN